jgi:hypothetical protein
MLKDGSDGKGKKALEDMPPPPPDMLPDGTTMDPNALVSPLSHPHLHTYLCPTRMCRCQYRDLNLFIHV